MKPGKLKRLLWGLIAGMLVYAGCDSAEPARKEIRFKEIKAKRGVFEITVTANGAVRPIDRIEIKSKASGIVEELPVEKGDFIRKGDLIARLDQKDEQAAYSQADADFKIAKAELRQAKRAFERREKLFSENLISTLPGLQIVIIHETLVMHVHYSPNLLLCLLTGLIHQATARFPYQTHTHIQDYYRND